MKKSTLALLISLVISSPAFSADWTPYVKSLKNTCGRTTLPYDGETLEVAKFPKALKSDIVKTGEYSDIVLKNATAFGLPLASIYEGDESGHGLTSILTFKSGDVSKLIPQFYFKDSKGKTLKAGEKKVYFVKSVIKNHTAVRTIVESVPYPKLKNNNADAIVQYMSKQYGKKSKYQNLGLLFGTNTGWFYYNDDGEDYDESFTFQGKRLKCQSSYGAGHWSIRSQL